MTKAPPYLIGAAVIFWGWQTGFLLESLVMAALLEGARFARARWEFSDEDFTRIWTFCTLLILGSAVFAFSANGGPENFRGLMRDPSLQHQSNVGASTARAGLACLRWLPMTFFLFFLAQVYHVGEGVPLATISLILRRRWRRAKLAGELPPPGRAVNLSYPYFAVCLFAASAHGGDDTTFFWGLCALLAWALWPQRSPRFALGVWAGALVVVIASGYFGQRGIGQLGRLLEGYNPQWLAPGTGRSFDPQQNQSELGQLGRIKPSHKIVIRLQTVPGGPPPEYLREASYRTFKSQVWYANTAKVNFLNVAPEKNMTSFILQPDKTNSAAVNLACYLAGNKALLPLPDGCGRLEHLPAYLVQTNSLGAVLAEGPGLVIFDALYGPGRTFDSAANTDEDLEVPYKERPALDQVISEMQLAGLTREQTLRKITEFFQSQFSYSLWHDTPRAGSFDETAVAEFLRARKGHCEYFATATVLLLRRLEIPARYAVGYSVHEGSGNQYVVRQSDAHAWCMVWNDRERIWQNFDTTPASWVAAEHEQASALQFFWDFWSRAGFELSKLRWGQTHLRQYLLWGLSPVLALLLAQIVFRRGRSRHRRQTEAKRAPMNWPGLDSEFYLLERELLAHGFARQPGEPLSSWLRRAAARPDWAGLRDLLERLMRLHYRHRFDPQGLSPAERAALRSYARACVEQLQAVGSG